ncbi:MAG TPA: polyphenol oxidase family protein [Gemmatimonadaceae bacterium]|nr:polyphenol oxidase family protein [Gemmatimonadaceae bacterium]
MTIIGDSERVDDFSPFGIRAFTTTRASGSFGLAFDDPVGLVMQRWRQLREELAPTGARLASAGQVHGSRVVVHSDGWEGWLRIDGADGHVAPQRGLALAVSVADCVPVFIAHPSGAVALLHSGWRGTAARIVERGIEALAQRGFPAGELRLHLGPAICGSCYQVGADVFRQLTGQESSRPAECVDLRALIAGHARAAGVRHITTSALCTRCDNDRLYSHRAGDAGRQIAVIYAEGLGTAA